ncbi:hypothetical protein A2U01_0036456 [Trifolium medium]|uniref:Uncharacterized protein n=1 Tax=Trifolium medium TaxID=97028 RepID=A0A392PT91_9FABA|nr:hypothetical protein [Trifolium medium]
MQEGKSRFRWDLDLIWCLEWGSSGMEGAARQKSWVHAGLGTGRRLMGAGSAYELPAAPGAGS